MVINPSHPDRCFGPVRTPGRRWLAAGALVLAVPWLQAATPPLESAHKVDRLVRPAGGSDGDKPAAEPVATRVASAANRADNPPSSPVPGREPATDPVARAKQSIAECQDRYQHIRDYTCTFVKRERIDDRLTPPHMMAMKARTSPKSVYFKFHQPNQGREAIYVHGRYNGRIVAHDVGLGRLLAGTMHLDPLGSMAMEDNRHPVTEAGIGALIDTVAKHWSRELTPGESVVTIHPDTLAGDRRCTLIVSVHPRPSPGFLFHKVKLYIDQEHGLPIRFEAYDWPKHAGGAAELVEEYAYLDLKINVGLRDHDFDPSNKQYSFGRF